MTQEEIDALIKGDTLQDDKNVPKTGINRKIKTKIIRVNI